MDSTAELDPETSLRRVTCVVNCASAERCYICEGLIATKFPSLFFVTFVPHIFLDAAPAFAYRRFRRRTPATLAHGPARGIVPTSHSRSLPLRDE
jgi:hypothetical protein